jgi:uncharacterized membrane protein YbhN (UPF0104 family)
MGDLTRWVEHAVRDLAGGLAGADPRWLLLGVLLHLGNQVARGCGWFAVVRVACPGTPVRRRDTIGAWVAGAGAGGVLSSRGGDAVRLLLLHRVTPSTGYPVLTGTLVAEAAAELAVGLAFVVAATSAGLWPGLGPQDPPSAAVLGAITAGVLVLGGLVYRSARVRRVVCGIGCGARVLGSPGVFARTVLPWQLLSRAARAASLACFLTAFALPATPAAVALVMLAQSGGRTVPLAPAGLGASAALLAATFGAVTGSEVAVSQLAVFVVAMSALLTAVGLGLAALVAARLAGTAAARAASARVSSPPSPAPG